MKITLMVLGLFFTSTLFAQSSFNSKPLFLVQNIQDSNQIILFPNTDETRLHILYITKNCKDCLKQLNNIRSTITTGRAFIICENSLYVTLKSLIDLEVQNQEIKKLIYHDPGGRLKAFFNIKESENSRLINIIGPQITLNRGTQLDPNQLRGFF